MNFLDFLVFYCIFITKYCGSNFQNFHNCGNSGHSNSDKRDKPYPYLDLLRRETSYCKKQTRHSVTVESSVEMYQYLLLLVLILNINTTPILASVISTSDCYANDTNPYLLFSSKTSYFTVENENADPIEIEGKHIFIIGTINKN